MNGVNLAIRLLVRYFAACILLYSGFLHFTHQFIFFDSILRYRILSWQLALMMALVLPAAHLLAGVQLIIPAFRGMGLATATALFALYAVAQWSVVARGFSIGCGCFGANSETISHWTALRVSALAVMLAYAWRFESRQEPS